MCVLLLSQYFPDIKAFKEGDHIRGMQPAEEKTELCDFVKSSSHLSLHCYKHTATHACAESWPAAVNRGSCVMGKHTSVVLLRSLTQPVTALQMNHHKAGRLRIWFQFFGSVSATFKCAKYIKVAFFFFFFFYFIDQVIVKNIMAGTNWFVCVTAAHCFPSTLLQFHKYPISYSHTPTEHFLLGIDNLHWPCCVCPLDPSTVC